MGNIMEKLELTAQSMYCKKIEELTPAEGGLLTRQSSNRQNRRQLGSKQGAT